MKNIFVIICLLFVSALSFWSVFPHGALAEGWRCPNSTSCYASQSECITQCSAAGSNKTCFANPCTPTSGNNLPSPSSPDSPGTPPPDSPGTPPGGGSRSLSLPNPLGAASTIPQLLERIARFLALLAVPLVAIMILVGAYQMLFAAGDPEKFGTGKKTILYAVIGYAIILIAWGVTGVIRGILRGEVEPSPASTSTPPPPPSVPGGLGASCGGDLDCVSGLFCNFSAGMPGRCSTTPLGGSGGVGASCATAADCTFPLFCDLSAGPGSPLVCSNR